MKLQHILITVCLCALSMKQWRLTDALEVREALEQLQKAAEKEDKISQTTATSPLTDTTIDTTVYEEPFVTKIFVPLGTDDDKNSGNSGLSRYDRVLREGTSKTGLAKGQHETMTAALTRLGLNKKALDSIAYQCPNNPSTKLECAVGWMQYGRSCYWLSPNLDETQTFDGAVDACTKQGANLLQLNDINEWNGLSDLLERQVRNYKAGAEDGIWVVIPTQRTPKIDFHCDQFLWDTTSNTWIYSEEHCLHKQWFICEKQLACPEPAAHSGICPDQFDELNQCCYYKAPYSEYTTFSDAQIACASKRAQIWTPTEHDFNPLLEMLEAQWVVENNHQYFDGFWIQSNQYTWNVHGTGMTACSEIRRGVSGWGLDAEICTHAQSFICKMCPTAAAPPSPQPPYNNVNVALTNNITANYTYNGDGTKTGINTYQTFNQHNGTKTLMQNLFNRTIPGTRPDHYTNVIYNPNGTQWQIYQTNQTNTLTGGTRFNQTIVSSIYGGNYKPVPNMNELFKPSEGNTYEAGDCRAFKYMCPGSMASCVNNGKRFHCVCHSGLKGDGYYCTDINECLQDPKICGPSAHCMNTFGSYKCVCGTGYQMEPSGHDCQESAICVTYGDPHYKTFDGLTIHYQGLCRVILAQGFATSSGHNRVGQLDPNLAVLPSDGQTLFRVEADGETRNGNLQFSWLNKLYLIFNRNEYTIGREGVLVNGQPVQTPYTAASRLLQITMQNGQYRIHTNFGLEMIHDGNAKAEVKLMANYKGRVTGVCGNYNGFNGDDMAGPDGRRIDNDIEFGNSWVTENARTDPACIKSLIGTNGTIPGGGGIPGEPGPDGYPGSGQQLCSPQSPAYKDAEKACFPIIDFSGVFQTCISFMRHELLEIFHSCVMDVCASGSTFRCQAINYAAETCALKGVTLVSNWAQRLGCEGILAGQQLSKNCDKGLTRLDCGPCIATCSDVMSQDKQCNLNDCRPGCFCPAGQVLDDKGGCIPIEQCGCKMGVLYMELGTSLYQNECSMLCSCYKEAQYHIAKCTPTQCHENASCVGPTGAQACYCNPGYHGNGRSCEAQYKLKLFDISEYLRRLH